MITFKTFIALAPTIMEQGLPILLRGRHGIGKSEVVRQIGKNAGLKVISRRISQMTEGDLLGLPIVSNDTTKWLPPDWYQEACKFPALLFFDEVDRGTLEVRQGLFELTDSRTMNGWNLHPKTVIFSAVNGGKHGENYQVGTMDPAELDRYAVFDLEPDVSDWVQWAKLSDDNGKQNVDTMVIEYISRHEKSLEHKGEIAPGNVYPSRRSWKRLSDVAAPAGYLVPGGSNMLPFLATAFVGIEVGNDFDNFVRNYKINVSAEDIISGKAMKVLNGLHAKGQTMPDSEQIAVIERFMSYAASHADLVPGIVADQKKLTNIANFFVNFGSEQIVAFFSKSANCAALKKHMFLEKLMVVKATTVAGEVMSLIQKNQKNMNTKA